jgi:hypothetical protein
MIVLRAGFVLAILVATFGCSKKDDSASGGKASGGGASASGLAWTPVGYDAMSAACKKALACCEEIAKTEGAKSAEDFNGKCSGPALWKDNECEMDLKARASSFEAANQPVPDACK